MQQSAETSSEDDKENYINKGLSNTQYIPWKNSPPEKQIERGSTRVYSKQR